MRVPRTDNRSTAIRAEDEEALALAESAGFVVRRTMQHRAHRIYITRCRERGIPCVCVYLRREVADVTLEMPNRRDGWFLSPRNQQAATALILRIGCAAYNVGPTRVAACRLPVQRARELARLISELAIASKPATVRTVELPTA